jgi:hypothetical protein
MADLTPINSEMEAVMAETPETESAKPLDPVAAKNKKISDSMKTRAEDSITHKRHFLNEWKRNIDVLLGTPVNGFSEGLDINADLQSTINPDWALTKTKTANLFSAVPTIRGTHENSKYAQAVSPFLKQLNYELGPKRANLGVAMRECLTDVVNAAGVAAAFVSYSARFDTVEISAADPQDALAAAPPPLPASGPLGPGGPGMPPPPGGPEGAPPAMPGMPPPMAPPPQPEMLQVQRPVSDMFDIKRISPRDLLWPSEFIGSDFNDADYIGQRARCPKAVGIVDFKLTPEQVEAATEVTPVDGTTELRNSQTQQPRADVETMAYTEIFYWRYRQDPDEKSFKAIWRLVLLDGLDEPVIHEPWKGQKYDEQTRTYVGACKFPIQVLTLMYVTDNPVPQSDTAAGRPQVQDMRRSRSQMFQNRERSIPIRWFDVNRIDQDLQANLMRGVVQGMIPTNGPGDRAIGEIARASYPSENIAFDQAAKADLFETWQVGPNQMGTEGQSRTTAAEANSIQANFSTRIGQERSFVAGMVLNLAEVMAGYLVLYSDFPILTDAEKQVLFQNWDIKHILHELVLNIVPDSTVLLDAEQRTNRLMKVLNMTVQSGFVNPEPIIAEILELNGLDPAVVMTKPQPKEDKPKIAYSFSGKDDMTNPIVVALMMNEGLFPKPEEIEKAKKVLDDLAMSAVMPPPPGQPGGPGGPPPPGPGPEPTPNGQQPPAHPDWEQMPKIATRSREVTQGA